MIDVDVTSLPGDIQIDLAIRKVQGGSHCLDRLIDRKVRAWLTEQEAPKPAKAPKR